MIAFCQSVFLLKIMMMMISNISFTNKASEYHDYEQKLTAN